MKDVTAVKSYESVAAFRLPGQSRRATVIIVACLGIYLVAQQSFAQHPPKLSLEITPRLASLRQSTVSPEVVSEYPLPSELLWEYQRAPNPRKPYVRYWTTPFGWNILRDSPADHLHRSSRLLGGRCSLRLSARNSAA
jgi:hypothetical protein